MTSSRLVHQNNMPSSSMQVAAFRNSLSVWWQYRQSTLKEQPRRRSLCQWPPRNMWIYSLRKSPWNYHPPDLTITPLNSRACSYSNKPRLTHWTPLNIKPTKSLSKNTLRQENFPFKIPSGHTALLHQKEGSWEIMPLPRLPVSQQPYYQEHLFPPPCLWPCQQTMRIINLHQVQNTMGI